jgi:GNAT superfamily N-acetyltransferase
MTIKEIDKANIDNLTSLWKKMGAKSYPSGGGSGMHASISWPHRFWFDWDFDTGQLRAIDGLLAQLPKRSIVPVWAKGESGIDRLEYSLKENSFGVILEQAAMYLDMENHAVVKKSPAVIAKIFSERDVEIWTQTASQAFGYEIDASVVQKIAKDFDIHLLLCYHEGKAAGTALLCKTGHIAGVHQVGVPEPYRGKGIASSLMLHVLDLCRTWGTRYVTLQASAAGKGLYKRLNFKEQFMIRSYQRPLVV